MVKSSGCRPCSLHQAHRATFSTVLSAAGIPDVIDAPAPRSRTGSPSIRRERRRPGAAVRIVGAANGASATRAIGCIFTTPGKRLLLFRRESVINRTR